MLGGFGKFMGKVFDTGAMGVLAVGAVLLLSQDMHSKHRGLNMFPMGLETLSETLRGAGLYIGLWIDCIRTQQIRNAKYQRSS